MFCGIVSYQMRLCRCHCIFWQSCNCVIPVWPAVTLHVLIWWLTLPVVFLGPDRLGWQQLVTSITKLFLESWLFCTYRYAVIRCRTSCLPFSSIRLKMKVFTNIYLSYDYNNQQVHRLLAVYYFILPLLPVSTRVCHYQGALPCLLSYIRIEWNGW
jgi:hypothetical protein